MEAIALSSIPLAPVLKPTLADMDDIASIMEEHAQLLNKHGAVLIDPPEDWQPPLLRIDGDFKFYVRHQKMPWVLVSMPQRTKKAEITEFTESVRKVSLQQYRAYAIRKDHQLWPLHNSGPDDNISAIPVIANVESKFWQLLDDGLNGNVIELVYGIDIENASDYGKLELPKDERAQGRSVEIAPGNDVARTKGNEAKNVAVGGGRSVMTREKQSTLVDDAGGKSVHQAENKLDVATKEKILVIEEELLDSGNANEILGSQLSNIDADNLRGRVQQTENGRANHPTRLKTAMVVTDFEGQAIAQISDDRYLSQMVEDNRVETEGRKVKLNKVEGRKTETHPQKNAARLLEQNEWYKRLALETERRDSEGELKSHDLEAGNKAQVTAVSESVGFGRDDREVFPSLKRLPVPPTKKRRVEKKWSDSHPYLTPGVGTGNGDRKRQSVGPKSHIGNINNQGVLRHLPIMPGINQPMFYIGHIFTRFCWHVEDAFLNSMAYLHDGSAAKVWYSVPPDKAEDFENFAAEMFGDTICSGRESAAALLKFKTAMFNPLRLMERGITVHRIVQKPRSFVVTAPRSYHSGFNCGFNISEAVNFGSPRWFPMGRKAAEELRAVQKQLFVPHELLLYREAVALDEHVQMVGLEAAMTNDTLVTHATVIADELLKYICEGEMAIEKFKRRIHCKVILWRSIKHIASTHELGPEYGAGAGILCDQCDYTCHFYVAMCASCKGNEKARCHLHFGRVCTKKDHKMVVVRRHEPKYLLRLLETAEKIAGKKVSQAKRDVRMSLICPTDDAGPPYELRSRDSIVVPRRDFT